jgi:hypothetical protein
MAKTKTKKRIDDDEDDILEPITPEPPPPRPRPDTAMVLDLEGHGGEVASALVVNGLRAYLSVTNKGVSLVAANRAHTAFVPVKVAASEGHLDVKRDEAKPLVEGQGVLAFLTGGDGDDDRRRFYLPVSEFLEMAEDRGDADLRLDAVEHAAWLAKYEGHAGIRRAFARLLS